MSSPLQPLVAPHRPPYAVQDVGCPHCGYDGYQRFLDHIGYAVDYRCSSCGNTFTVNAPFGPAPLSAPTMPPAVG